MVPTMNETNFPGFTCINAIYEALGKRKPRSIKDVSFVGNNDDREVWVRITLKNGKKFKVTACEED